MYRHLSRGQNAGRLGRNHRFAAFLALIRAITRHGTTALHALLVLGYSGHAVSELQKQYRGYRQSHEDDSPSHTFELYGG
jgi:hypothetical protein